MRRPKASLSAMIERKRHQLNTARRARDEVWAWIMAARERARERRPVDNEAYIQAKIKHGNLLSEIAAAECRLGFLFRQQRGYYYRDEEHGNE
jgi:hypothetical protein